MDSLVAWRASVLLCEKQWPDPKLDLLPLWEGACWTAAENQNQKQLPGFSGESLSQLTVQRLDISSYSVVASFHHRCSMQDAGGSVQDLGEGMMVGVMIHVLMLIKQAVHIGSELQRQDAVRLWALWWVYLHYMFVFWRFLGSCCISCWCCASLNGTFCFLCLCDILFLSVVVLHLPSAALCLSVVVLSLFLVLHLQDALDLLHLLGPFQSFCGLFMSLIFLYLFRDACICCFLFVSLSCGFNYACMFPVTDIWKPDINRLKKGIFKTQSVTVRQVFVL